MNKKLEAIRDEKALYTSDCGPDAFVYGFDAAVKEMRPLIDALIFYSGINNDRTEWDLTIDDCKKAKEVLRQIGELPEDIE